MSKAYDDVMNMNSSYTKDELKKLMSSEKSELERELETVEQKIDLYDKKLMNPTLEKTKLLKVKEKFDNKKQVLLRLIESKNVVKVEEEDNREEMQQLVDRLNEEDRLKREEEEKEMLEAWRLKMLEEREERLKKEEELNKLNEMVNKEEQVEEEQIVEEVPNVDESKEELIKMVKQWLKKINESIEVQKFKNTKLIDNFHHFVVESFLKFEERNPTNSLLNRDDFEKDYIEFLKKYTDEDEEVVHDYEFMDIDLFNVKRGNEKNLLVLERLGVKDPKNNISSVIKQIDRKFNDNLADTFAYMKVLTFLDMKKDDYKDLKILKKKVRDLNWFDFYSFGIKACYLNLKYKE